MGQFSVSSNSATDKSADRGQIAELAAIYRDRVMGDIDAAFAKAASAA